MGGWRRRGSTWRLLGGSAMVSAAIAGVIFSVTAKQPGLVEPSHRLMTLTPLPSSKAPIPDTIRAAGENWSGSGRIELEGGGDAYPWSMRSNRSRNAAHSSNPPVFPHSVSPPSFLFPSQGLLEEAFTWKVYEEAFTWKVYEEAFTWT